MVASHAVAARGNLGRFHVSHGGGARDGDAEAAARSRADTARRRAYRSALRRAADPLLAEDPRASALFGPTMRIFELADVNLDGIIDRDEVHVSPH